MDHPDRTPGRISPGAVPFPTGYHARNSYPYRDDSFPHTNTQASWDTPSLLPDPPRIRAHSYNPGSHLASTIPPPISSTLEFPVPQLYDASNKYTALQPGHRHSNSSHSHTGRISPSSLSVASTPPSYIVPELFQAPTDEFTEKDNLTHILATIALDADEGLRRFQAGDLPENAQEWHCLVPPGAIDALGMQEVRRQSVIFEVIKSEQGYVTDLEAVQNIFVDGLRSAYPPIIEPSRMDGFIANVFGNIGSISSHHNCMLSALFARQREQHPLIQSVSDILLDTTLKSDFRQNYEIYIKRYPLAESHHRKEMKGNPAYAAFIRSSSDDPRIRKRDLTTFLSRPVTRLPRLNLLLEQILKITEKEYEHPDTETLPIILRIFSDCIKSAQPGIEAAESKVKFWGLCDSLKYQKGEIITLDLYDESRTLVFSSSLVRRMRTETGFHSWVAFEGSLLDHYFLLTSLDKGPNGSVIRRIMSRPLPLSYVRLGEFNAPPEMRRERAEDNSILDSLRKSSVPLFPFTIYHASRPLKEYTLYVTSESQRQNWRNAFIEALGVHRVRQDANLWFYQNMLTEKFFRLSGRTVRSESLGHLTGGIRSAVPFRSRGRKFLAVACEAGIYVSLWGSEAFQRVLPSNANAIFALHADGERIFNRFVVHVEPQLIAYSLDIVARVALGDAGHEALKASMEQLGDKDAHVVFARYLQVGKLSLIFYGSKRRLGSAVTLHVLEALGKQEIDLMSPKLGTASAMRSFRAFGEPGYIPRDVYDMTSTGKTIGICTHSGIIVADPTNISAAVSVIPQFQNANINAPMADLKALIDAAKPLGMVRVNAAELMVVYENIGCYITKDGFPTRLSGYIKWETKARACAHRGDNLLLFSPEFLEVRSVASGKIVQVIEGQHIRLLYGGVSGIANDLILVGMKGKEKDDAEGASGSEMIVELVETSEIKPSYAPRTSIPSALWDEQVM